jgi:GxxExxY protein
VIELETANLVVETERTVSLAYRGQRVRRGLKIDLLVESCLVVEAKAVDLVHPVHLAQVITYPKLTGHPAGLLLNFNVTSLRNDLKRLVHPELYGKK